MKREDLLRAFRPMIDAFAGEVLELVVAHVTEARTRALEAAHACLVAELEEPTSPGSAVAAAPSSQPPRPRAGPRADDVERAPKAVRTTPLADRIPGESAPARVQ